MVLIFFMAAPIAQFDDDWDNFASFATSNDQQIWQSKCSKQENGTNDFVSKNASATNNDESLQFCELSNSESIEDLVHSFDEKLASCFRISKINTDTNFPNSTISSLDSYGKDPIWKRLKKNYGLVQPLDWNNSHIKKLYLPALCLPFHNESNDDCEQALSKVYHKDEEDIQPQMNYHHMISYNVYTDNDSLFDGEMQSADTQGNSLMQTADEVIEELEEMMNFNAALDYELQEETGIVFNENLSSNNFDEDFEKPISYRQSLGSMSSIEETVQASELKLKSLQELNAENEELDSQVQSLSMELLEVLNKRDELQYEIEVKREFISKVLEVQYKRDEISKLKSSKKFSGLRKNVTTEPVAFQGKYLTTVIPCNKGDVPTTDNLQSLIKILDAMKLDSDEVPSLLTSYILQVICPAPSGNNAFKL